MSQVLKEMYYMYIFVVNMQYLVILKVMYYKYIFVVNMQYLVILKDNTQLFISSNFHATVK